MRTVLFTLFICLALAKATAQTPIAIPATDTVPPKITSITENGAIRFNAELRPLRPIAGAPAPFYTYFWEFGDGGFSFEESPSHIFKTLDSVKVRLFATNNYDDGKRPPTRPKPIKPVGNKPLMASNTTQSGFFKMGGSTELKSNCMPKPGDEMMLVLGYRNKAENGIQNLNGTLAILYNDKEFSSNNFILEEARTYNQEKKSDLNPLINTAFVPSQKNNREPVYYASTQPYLPSDKVEKILLKEKLKDFRDVQGWRFENLKTNEERFVFLQFKTTPEMLKDTNAVVRLSGAFIPDHPLLETEFFTIELQIVASHDPNKMVLRKSRLNYRFTSKNRELTYKVRFQNTGKGPAKKIDVGVSISPVFDSSTLKVTKTKPEVINCDSAYANQSCLQTLFKADSVHFVFNNIYLPGMQQKGVKDADSTMGFVEYKIRFKEKPEKLPIKSGAAIVFDKNEPIYTNRAVARFKMGLSPGFIIGYGFPFGNQDVAYLDTKNITIGATLSPYASHRYYWQAEAFLTSYQKNTYPAAVENSRKDTVINNVGYVIADKQLLKTSKVLTLNAVPLQLRYNLNKYIAVGAGAFVTLDLYHKTANELRYLLRTINAQGTITEVNLNRDAEPVNQHFSDIRASAFADVQFGLVRVGPALGCRYIYDPVNRKNNLMTYLAWKF